MLHLDSVRVSQVFEATIRTGAATVLCCEGRVHDTQFNPPNRARRRDDPTEHPANPQMPDKLGTGVVSRGDRPGLQRRRRGRPPPIQCAQSVSRTQEASAPRLGAVLVSNVSVIQHHTHIHIHIHFLHLFLDICAEGRHRLGYDKAAPGVPGRDREFYYDRASSVHVCACR